MNSYINYKLIVASLNPNTFGLEEGKWYTAEELHNKKSKDGESILDYTNYGIIPHEGQSFWRDFGPHGLYIDPTGFKYPYDDLTIIGVLHIVKDLWLITKYNKKTGKLFKVTSQKPGKLGISWKDGIEKAFKEIADRFFKSHNFVQYPDRLKDRIKDLTEYYIMRNEISYDSDTDEPIEEFKKRLNNVYRSYIASPMSGRKIRDRDVFQERSEKIKNWDYRKYIEQALEYQYLEQLKDLPIPSKASIIKRIHIGPNTDKIIFLKGKDPYIVVSAECDLKKEQEGAERPCFNAKILSPEKAYEIIKEENPGAAENLKKRWSSIINYIKRFIGRGIL